MGLFDKAFKIFVDPGDLTGYEAGKRASEQAERFGQQSFDLQSDYLDFIKQQTTPFTESALRALEQQEALVGLGGPEAQAEQIANLQASPFYDQLIDQGEEAILRNQAATGGLRSGGTQQALAQNSQNVLQGLYNQQLQNLAGLSTRGAQAQSQFQQAGGPAISGLTGTLGQIGNIGINQAAQQKDTGLGLLGLAASFFSDERLKENIVPVGNSNGLTEYTWCWNSEAEKLGLSGESRGYLAGEVEKLYPELVGEKAGYKTVNYGGFH